MKKTGISVISFLYDRSDSKHLDMKKRGIFFTSIAIVIITLLILTYTVYSKAEERKTIQRRIETMNTFAHSLEQDISRKVFIAGFRSIFTFENKIIESGSYISNVNASFQEMFFNGSLNGVSQPIMSGATLADILNSISSIGDKVNINVTITNPQIIIDQVDPWSVRVKLTGNLTIKDSGNLASWERVLSAESFIPLYYFDDPIYTINTGGIIIQKINQTIYSQFDSSTLLIHTQQKYYKASTEAPSFLDRLEGNIALSSPYGIESLVDLDDLQNKGLSISPKSIVDHAYFSQANPSACHIAGMPSWFYLDNSHLSSYNASC
ncbi:MAG: hypothetical protein ACP5NS_03645 [Candidatus Pacearchaeota archaeon]